jgi:hypothetical protein
MVRRRARQGGTAARARALCASRRRGQCGATRAVQVARGWGCEVAGGAAGAPGGSRVAVQPGHDGGVGGDGGGGGAVVEHRHVWRGGRGRRAGWGKGGRGGFVLKWKPFGVGTGSVCVRASTPPTRRGWAGCGGCRGGCVAWLLAGAAPGLMRLLASGQLMPGLGSMRHTARSEACGPHAHGAAAAHRGAQSVVGPPHRLHGDRGGPARCRRAASAGTQGERQCSAGQQPQRESAATDQVAHGRAVDLQRRRGGPRQEAVQCARREHRGVHQGLGGEGRGGAEVGCGVVGRRLMG